MKIGTNEGSSQKVVGKTKKLLNFLRSLLVEC
jgi:hypothetical protein